MVKRSEWRVEELETIQDRRVNASYVLMYIPNIPTNKQLLYTILIVLWRNFKLISTFLSARVSLMHV